MRNSALWIILICGAAALLFAILAPSGPRAIGTPLTKQMSEMKRIGVKLRDYALDLSATKADTLKDKSINDLVAMNVLSPADAAYLADHQIRFYGYDLNHVSGDVPIFEGTYPRNTPRWRIVVYSDISVVSHDLNDNK